MIGNLGCARREIGKSSSFKKWNFTAKRLEDRLAEPKQQLEKLYKRRTR